MTNDRLATKTLDSSHVLTRKGEFREVMRVFGLRAALMCWENTHPAASLTVKSAAGLSVGAAAVLVIASAAGLL